MPHNNIRFAKGPFHITISMGCIRDDNISEMYPNDNVSDMYPIDNMTETWPHDNISEE